MSPAIQYCSECGRPAPADELAHFGDQLICANCKDRYAQKLREGVPAAIAVRYAGFWIRFLAVIIDSIILMFVGGIVQFMVLGSTFTRFQYPPRGNPEELLGPLFARLGLVWAISLVINSTYEALFVYKLAATPGKLALGLKVIRPGGGPISLGRAFGRHFSKILSGMILLIGYIMAGFDAEKRALHDMICDTRVIRTRDI